MKFMIDTEKKLITLEESTNLSTFVQTVEQMLGDDWVKYTLLKTVVFNYNWSVINIHNPVQFPILQPYQPTFPLPTIICYDSSSGTDVVTGFNKKALNESKSTGR